MSYLQFWGAKPVTRNSEPGSKDLVCNMSVTYLKHLDNGFSVSRSPPKRGRKKTTDFSKHEKSTKKKVQVAKMICQILKRNEEKVKQLTATQAVSYA